MPAHDRPRLLGAAVVRTWAWLPFAVLVVAQIAVPLTDHAPTLEWLSTVVVLAFAATTLVLAADHWGWARATGALAWVVGATLVVERIGSTTGVPFGEYHYTGALSPTLVGVPVIVPLAWFAMGVAALEVGHRVAATPIAAVVAGAVALTAWDLFLDPQMVDAGYWRWAADGAYRGIPLSNYAGWLLVGVVVLGGVERIRLDPLAASVPLLALYTWWAVMSTIGFVVFFGDPFVGLVGGLGMGSVTLAAWTRGFPAGAGG